MSEDMSEDLRVEAEFFRVGMDAAVHMARAGNLRLAPLPWERDKYPHTGRIRPWRITRLAWSSWWKECRGVR